MQPFNKKAPTEAGASSLQFAPFSPFASPAVCRPVPLFAILKRFKDVIIRVCPRLFGQVAELPHHVTLENTDVLKFGQVADDAGKRSIQTPQGIVSVGLLRWFRIRCSHCSSNPGMVVRDASVVEHGRIPFARYSRKPRPKICQIQIRTLPKP